MRFKSVASFVIFLIVGFVFFNKTFSSVNYYVNTIEDFDTLSEQTNIDVIFYGSSHAYTAYNPLIINKLCKTLSYNLGSDALTISLTDMVLLESLKKTKPKLVVLEVYPPSLVLPSTDAQKGYQLRAMDNVSNCSALKWRKMKRLYNKKEYLGVFVPLLRNHKNWYKNRYFNMSRRKKLNDDQNFFYAGFIGSSKEMSAENKETYKGYKDEPVVNNPNRLWVTESGRADLKEFIEIAKNSGAEVLVVSSPDARARTLFNYHFFTEVNDICKMLGVSFLNLNDYLNEMDLDLADFKDHSHLNTFGSTKASIFLAKYINEVYTLPDRSFEDVWKVEINEFSKFINNYDIEKNILK